MMEIPAAAESRDDHAEGLSFLDPRRIRFSRSGAALRMTIEGDCTHLRVAIFRAFPLSEPQRYLSVRNAGGKEIGLISRWSELGEEDRLLVASELERRYLLTPVRRVLRVEERFGTVDWHVETSRGPRIFTTRDPRENVRRLSSGARILTDVEGNRYEIPDAGVLDSVSRALLLRYL